MLSLTLSSFSHLPGRGIYSLCQGKNTCLLQHISTHYHPFYVTHHLFPIYWSSIPKKPSLDPFVITSYIFHTSPPLVAKLSLRRLFKIGASTCFCSLSAVLLLTSKFTWDCCLSNYQWSPKCQWAFLNLHPTWLQLSSASDTVHHSYLINIPFSLGFNEATLSGLFLLIGLLLCQIFIHLPSTNCNPSKGLSWILFSLLSLLFA